MNKYEKMTQEDFDRILMKILRKTKAIEMIIIPGFYEIASETFNNEILEQWEKEQEELNKLKRMMNANYQVDYKKIEKQIINNLKKKGNKMITLEQAKNLKWGDELLHVEWKNADKSAMRFKVNGQVKTWKRNPNKIRVPLKYGLYEFGYLVNEDDPPGNGFVLQLKDVEIRMIR